PLCQGWIRVESVSTRVKTMFAFLPGRGLTCALPVTSFVVAAGFMAWLAASGGLAEPPAKSARAPWTTSRVVGSPDPPPPFKVVRAFPNLKFEHPLLIARPPAGDRLFVGEQAGVLYSFPDKPDAKADLFFDLRKEVKTVQL